MKKMMSLAKGKPRAPELVTELIGGEPYSYYPLGEYLVAAPGVCGGRPTIKGRRLDARHIFSLLQTGETPAQIAANYSIPLAAVIEARRLATVYDYETSYA